MRGVAPVALAVKAVLELVIALVVGSAVGFGVAYGLVVWLGPSALVEPAALGWAAVGASAALLVSGLTIGVVVALRPDHTRSDGADGRGWPESLGRCPWGWRPGCRTSGWVSGACR